MISAAVLLVASLSAAVAIPHSQQKIIGGSLATISQYPFAAPLLYSWNLVTYSQACGGTILTTRAVLTAGHCVYGDLARSWRVRVGSSYANSGGVVHQAATLVVNPRFNYNTLDFDVALIKTATAIAYIANAVQPANIAGSNYNLADDQPVYAVGWGTTAVNGQTSEQLRHVQNWSINQSICRSRYTEVGGIVSENMLCSGWLDVGGRDQCQGDSGGPLLHNGVVVGICSWGYQCALPRYPGVNTRVSKFTTWIQANAV